MPQNHLIRRRGVTSDPFNPPKPWSRRLMIGGYIVAAPFVFAFVLIDDLIYWNKNRRIFHQVLHWPLNTICLWLQRGSTDYNRPPLG